MGQRREHAIDRMPATGQRREDAIDRMPATGQRRRAHTTQALSPLLIMGVLMLAVGR